MSKQEHCASYFGCTLLIGIAKAGFAACSPPKSGENFRFQACQLLLVTQVPCSFCLNGSSEHSHYFSFAFPNIAGFSLKKKSLTFPGSLVMLEQRTQMIEEAQMAWVLKSKKNLLNVLRDFNKFVFSVGNKSFF